MAMNPNHPGRYVRDTVLTPKKLSVVAAAKLVGVGRPAFSNFLNGNATTTSDMASRIEVAFGIPARKLLDLQAAFDANEAKASGNSASAVPYVVPFLGITAREIEEWANRRIAARVRLPVLLRTLVHSAPLTIRAIDFPGNDDAERPGWDGFVEVEQGMAWIPEGKSGWEFGTTGNVLGKANHDFAKSVRSVEAEIREEITFVFVTPQHWAGKDAWVAEQKAKSQWKDVRAYDSSDLEQWIETSIPAQVWFRQETNRPSEGIATLDQCWSEWADVATPPLKGSFFATAVDGAKESALRRLQEAPKKPIVIFADSVSEALAFLAQLFGDMGGPELAAHRGKVLVFRQAGILPKLAQGATDFIAVAASREVERELGRLSHSLHSIAIYPRNASNVEADITLEPLGHEAFRKSLEDMGYDQDSVSRYDGESGRSLTVLRRRLAVTPAVRTPEWVEKDSIAVSLIPFMLVGAWSSANPKDQEALCELAATSSYEELETRTQVLMSLDDAPLWSVGTFRGVISKIDLLFSIASAMTALDLKRYFKAAKKILGEDDPTLDLPEEERWAAALHRKSREYSAALRQGCAETLVLLAVHGNHLFFRRLGFNCEAEVTTLVRDLLKPLKTRILEANDRDLTAYAEAAPDEFLSILEEDLRSPAPETFALMKPVDAGIFGGGCTRSGLLWALEGLAWSPSTLIRAASVLAKLAEIEINDNWTNKPINSLQAIFRSWMPQTAANLDSRVRVLEMLSARYPKAAWAICIAQVDMRFRTGSYSHKPKWRNDASGFGQPVKSVKESYSFVASCVELALKWPHGYTRERLCDLVGILHALSKEHQARVWDLVKVWAGGATDDDKSAVREKIRVTVLSRWGAKQSKTSDYARLSAAAKVACNLLLPGDVISKHDWLFKENWVAESADELHDDTDYAKREERISSLRTDALKEIYSELGSAGVFKLAELGKASGQIGWLMSNKVLARDEICPFLLSAIALASDDQHGPYANLIFGAFNGLQDEGGRVEILQQARLQLPEVAFTRLLILAPFRRSSWRLVDTLSAEAQRLYWDEVNPSWIFQEDDQNHEAVERLLVAKRPRAAFSAIHFKLETIGPELLFRLLWAIARGGNDKPGHFQLEQYYVEEAFALLDKSTAITLEQKAGLEYAYIDALSKPWSTREKHGIPNLEKYVETHPEVFVQAVVWTYRRKDEGRDPEEWTATDADGAKGLAERGYKLLEGIKRIPGHNHLGVFEFASLLAWVNKVRDSLKDLGRLDIGDVCIGKLLSSSQAGEDGVWPSEPVRDILEHFQSKAMMEGAHTGIYNSRGVVWRGEGGAQERELAAKYRSWGTALQYSHPFVAAELLHAMAATYEHEANQEDTRASVRRRLH